MRKLIGDSTRDGSWALVRLGVEGDRIVTAEAEGLERPLEGLTLLEAAAVGGDELAVDALANALGQAFRARTGGRSRCRCHERRGRQRGHSATRRARGDRRHSPALARPARPGRRARLLLAGGSARRPRHLPPARPAARDARPARGVQARRGRAVRARLRRGADAEPVHPLQRELPLCRAARVCRRAGAERLATGHYARIVEHRGRACSPAPPIRPRTSRTCWRGSIRASSTGSGSRSASRARTRLGRGRARRARGRLARREPGGLLPGRRRLPRVPRASWSRLGDGPIVDEEGKEVGRHSGFWRFTPGQRRGLGVAAGEPVFALRSEPRTNTVVIGPARRWPPTRSGHAAASTSTSTGQR